MTIFEIEEIENVLQQHRQIRHAIVQAKADDKGIQRFVRYIVPKGTLDWEEMTGFLKEKLPAHRIPSIWVEMEDLPLTSGGNINKKLYRK